MSKVFTPLVLALCLGGCMTLPGADLPTTSRYTLMGPEASCEAGSGNTLVLSVARVNAGLDTERIARRNAGTGEIAYLKDVRWADQAGTLVEQRLAQDLECRGLTVLSSHHHKLGQRQLICEVRALNLVEHSNRDEAEVGLSCLLYRTGGDPDKPFVSTHTSTLTNWSATSAVAAVSRAYQAVLADLLDVLGEG